LECKKINEKTLVLESPGKVIRQVTDKEIEDIKLNAQHYVVNLLKEKVDTKENLLLNQINCLFIISI